MLPHRYLRLAGRALTDAETSVLAAASAPSDRQSWPPTLGLASSANSTAAAAVSVFTSGVKAFPPCDYDCDCYILNFGCWLPWHTCNTIHVVGSLSSTKLAVQDKGLTPRHLGQALLITVCVHDSNHCRCYI